MVAARHFYRPVSLWGSLNRSVERSLSQVPVEQHSEEMRSWMPGVDIYENTDAYVLLVDVPGVAPDNIDITFNEGVLTIQGERQSSELPDTATYKYRERGFGQFERHFRLPEKADSEQISASSEHGVLRIRIGKSAKAQPRRIAVNH